MSVLCILSNHSIFNALIILSSFSFISSSPDDCLLWSSDLRDPECSAPELKQSLQYTGLLFVGLKGTSDSLPHLAQVIVCICLPKPLLSPLLNLERLPNCFLPLSCLALCSVNCLIKL